MKVTCASPKLKLYCDTIRFTGLTPSMSPPQLVSARVASCRAARALLNLSVPRRSFWYSGFSTPQARHKRSRNLGVAYLTTIFLMPSLCVYFGATPSFLNWWMQTYRLMEYPPQADPAIIKAILNEKTPPASSNESETNTNSGRPRRRFVSVSMVASPGDQTAMCSAVEVMRPIGNSRIVALDRRDSCWYFGRRSDGKPAVDEPW